jgi:two-component sensor histidine kinase
MPFDESSRSYCREIFVFVRAGFLEGGRDDEDNSWASAGSRTQPAIVGIFARSLAGRGLFRVRHSIRIEWTRWVQHLKSVVRNHGRPGLAAARQVKRLEAQIAYRQLLLEEVIHRAKNTLQIAVATIDDQIDATSDYDMRKTLRAARKELRGLCDKHNSYYSPHYAERSTLASHLSEICWSVLDSYDERSGRIHLSISITDVELNRHQEVSLSLIVDELLTNVFKHAFPDNRLGTIAVSFDVDARSMCHLVVRDDGVADYFVRRASTGLAVVRGFASGLQGSFEWAHHNGTTARVSFPLVANPL